MRQQLVSWLIDDIAPAARESGNPEAAILKFASERNLEPALVEGLGQLMNTAKTLNFIQKAAHKGDSFPLLDVESMVKKYLTVHVKEAKPRGMSCYDQLDWDRPGLPDLFKNIPGLSVRLEGGESVMPVKMASAEEKPMTEVRRRQMLQNLDQCEFDLTEDVREILQKNASYLKQNSLDFKGIEQDALGLFGDDIRPICDSFASFCKAAHLKVERAPDGGPARLVKDNYGILDQLKEAAHKLLKVAEAKKLRAELTKSAHAEVAAEPATPVVRERPARDEQSAIGSALGLSTAAKPSRPDAAKPEVPAAKGPAGDSKSYPESVGKALDSAASPITQGIPELSGHLSKILGTGSNKDQQHVDTVHQDTKHITVLQNLLMTDEVLAEAEPKHVVDMYNTLRRLSPHLAEDPNLARVALRTMVQHDGVSPFDAKNFLDTEQAHQKSRFGQHVLNEIDYGGATPPKPTKV